jgi:CDP-diglyceride synthetase
MLYIPACRWEGFIGGAIGTVMLGLVLATTLSHFKWMVCPRRVRAVEEVSTMVQLTCCIY